MPSGDAGKFSRSTETETGEAKAKRVGGGNAPAKVKCVGGRKKDSKQKIKSSRNRFVIDSSDDDDDDKDDCDNSYSAAIKSAADSSSLALDTEDDEVTKNHFLDFFIPKILFRYVFFEALYRI